MEVSIEAEVHNTEDDEKVRKAVLNIFPDADIEKSDGKIVARTHTLDRFQEILRDLRIRDTARHFLMGKIEGDRIKFSISKQAAFMGKISLGGTNPALGEIGIEIRDENPTKLIHWLTFTGE